MLSAAVFLTVSNTDAKLYIGAKTGMAYLHSDVHVNYYGAYDGNKRYRMSVIGPAVYAFAGAEKRLSKRFWIALEAGAGFGWLNAKNDSFTDMISDSSFATRLEERGGYALCGILGFQHSPATGFYLRLGVEMTSMKFTMTQTNLSVRRGTLSQTRTFPGLLAGAGVRVRLGPKTAFIGEFSHTLYASRTFMYTLDGQPSYPNKVQPQIGRVFLGVRYDIN